MPKKVPLTLVRDDDDEQEETHERSPGYTSLKLKQNNHTIYYLTIPVSELVPYCYVSRRSEDFKHGFQRNLSEDRADDIAAYLKSGDGSVPSNIVLSTQACAELDHDVTSKGLSFLRTKGAFLVIDGQHRLRGYEKCGLDLRVPVALYVDLTTEEEVRLFVTINRKQQSVPDSLIEEIKHLGNMESPEDRLLRGWYDKLADDKTSPLHGKINRARPASSKPSLRTFKRALTRVLGGPTLSELSDAKKYALIASYLKGCHAALKDKDLISKAPFFEAIFEAFDDVIRAAKEIHKSLKTEYLAQTFHGIAGIDFEKLTPKPTRQVYAKAIRNALPRNVRISQDDIE